MCLSLSFHLFQAWPFQVIRHLIVLIGLTWDFPPTHSVHWPGNPIEGLVWCLNCWLDPLGNPWSWLTPCCADGPCYLPPTFSLVGLHHLVRACLRWSLPSAPVPAPPGPGNPISRVHMQAVDGLCGMFIQLLACPFHKENAGQMAVAALPWWDGQNCLFLAAIPPFLLSLCSLTPLLPLGQLEGCHGQGFSSWQSRSHCTALCNASCCG